MRSKVLRLWLIGALAVAAAISVVGNKTDSAFIGWLSFVVFLGALFLYVTWRRAVLTERRGGSAERRGKGDETRTRTDQ
jgi:hypothetical protein